MSDKANPGTVASRTPLSGAGEFDARLRQADENRWLAARYAPEAARGRMVAIYLLHIELQRALQTSEPMLGKIRVQWWRETLEQLARDEPVRRHDLAEELARHVTARLDLLDPMKELVDRFDDIIDDHLHAGGHKTDADHAERHLAAEASLTQLAGRSLVKAVSAAELDILARCGEAHLAVVAQLPDANERWDAAAKAARRLPAALWPAIVHLAAVHDPYRVQDNPRTARKAPLMKRWRMLQAMASKRLWSRSP